MSIGLFADIDNTLTKGFVQHYYAANLGVSRAYQDLEARFQEGQLDEAEFGIRIVSIFAAHGLTTERARKIARNIPLRAKAADVLMLPDRLPVDLYLVSSGPSYYADHLVEKYPHLKNRVIRSKYTFDPVTPHLLSGCEAISARHKEEFVAKYARQYGISVGVGDSVRFDGPFLQHCTVPLHLVTARRLVGRLPFPIIQDLSPLLRLVERLAEATSPEA